MFMYYRFPPARSALWNPKFTNKLKKLAIVVGIYYGLHIDRVEETKRYRFLAVPDWLERKLANSVYQSTLATYKPFILPPRNYKSQMVEHIMAQLVKASDQNNTKDKDVKWTTHVIKGDFPPNAFVLPGGKVFVFESLFKVCQNKDGLATVLSHETAHQILKHSNEQLSRQPFKWAIAIMLNVFLGTQFDPRLLGVFTDLPASRKMEIEADTVGLKLMARACFNPMAAIPLWQRMAQCETAIPQFLSTHPTSATRIKNLEKNMPDAELAYGLCGYD